MAHMLRRTLVLALAMIVWGSGHAANLYRYENDEGKIVYDDRVPPDIVHKGYTVLSEEGRVVRVVPPQLTPQERKVRDAELARQKAERRRLEDRRASDKELLRLYKSVGDVKRARDRKLEALGGAIRLRRENLNRLLRQKSSVETHAGELERGGLPVSVEVMKNLRIVDEQIAEQHNEIESRERTQDAVRVQFEKDIARVKELLDRSARYTSS